MQDTLIDALNALLKTREIKGKFIIQFNNEQHPQFKLYKNFHLTLWFVASAKDRSKRFTIDKVLRCPTGEEDKAKNIMIMELYSYVLNCLIDEGEKFLKNGV